MKKIKPRIYLLMENKKRELDARIYFALKASLSNFSIVIGRKAHIFDNRKRMQKGIVIFKSVGRRNFEWIMEFKRLGFIVGAIDEEGMNFFNPKEYIERIYPSCIENIDIFFCWGENDYNAIIETYPMMDGKIYKTGNSRIDILKKPLDKKYFKKAENIKKKEGDFILVNTMFSKANNYLLCKQKQNYIDSLIEDGHKPDSIKVKLAKPYLNFQEQNLKLLKNFLNNYSTKYPNEKIIIRPHPGEYSEMWEDFAKNKKNMKVSIDQINTCSWILASKKQVTSNCTTSVEGYFLNRIAANYIVFKDEKVEFKLPKLMSINIRKDEDLIKYLKEKNDYKIETHNIINLVKKSIHNINNKECSVKYFIDSLNANEFVKTKINSFFSEDKFSGFFYSIFFNIYYYIRFIYRKLLTKQDKEMSTLIMKKFPRLDAYEMQDTINEYKSYLEIKEKIKLKQIYPQVFSIEKE